MFNNVLFIGCGNMGSILLGKFIANNSFSHQQIRVVKPSLNNQIQGISYHQNFSQLPNNYKADIIFICIKPQNSEIILKELSQTKIFDEDTIFVSTLAGKKINFFLKIFSKKTKIIRIMPNILIHEDQGIIPYYNSKTISINEDRFFQNLFKNFAIYFAISDEKSFHIFTAIFASGPAYIFLIAEILVNIATTQKIENNLAINLVQKLIYGSALSLNGSNNFKNLRDKVTSPKGTTASAIDRLTKNNSLHKLLQNAISQAVKTSKKLS
jgi:pyrroline-5-carboxylate reductase